MSNFSNKYYYYSLYNKPVSAYLIRRSEMIFSITLAFCNGCVAVKVFTARGSCQLVTSDQVVQREKEDWGPTVNANVYYNQLFVYAIVQFIF